MENYYIGKFITEKNTNNRYLITGIDYVNNSYIIDNSPLRIDIRILHKYYWIDNLNQKRLRIFD